MSLCSTIAWPCYYEHNTLNCEIAPFFHMLTSMRLFDEKWIKSLLYVNLIVYSIFFYKFIIKHLYMNDNSDVPTNYYLLLWRIVCKCFHIHVNERYSKLFVILFHKNVWTLIFYNNHINVLRHNKFIMDWNDQWMTLLLMKI